MLVELLVMAFAKRGCEPRDVVTTAYVIAFYSSTDATNRARKEHSLPARFHASAPSEE
jgi:hypothetical protein